MSDPVNFNGLANRGAPIQAGDGQRVGVHTTRAGDLITVPLFGTKMYAAAQGGAYFVATNPTLGTAIAGKTAPTALADTSALMYVRNDPANNRQLMLDNIVLMVAAAGTNGTDWQFSMQGDKSTSRYTSGGTNLTPVCSNMGSANTPGLDSGLIRFGDLTLTAATSSARIIHHGLVRTVIKQVGDKYTFRFGDSSVGPISGIPLEGTTQANINIACPPLILDPGDSFIFREVATAQSAAATYQLTMGFLVF